MKNGRDPIVVFCRERLGFVPGDLELYRIAFTHKSYSHMERKGNVDAKSLKINNERLEYLGDALLSAIVADYLYIHYPDKGEGFLTELRAKIVSRNSLNGVAKELRLDALVRCDSKGQHHAQSIDGNTFEALVGAIYLDKGYRFAEKVVKRKVLEEIIDVKSVENTDWNYKSKLYDYCQKGRKVLAFEVVNTTYRGREHRPEYEVRVMIDGEEREHGVGSTIKGAEQMAAEATYKKLLDEE